MTEVATQVENDQEREKKCIDLRASQVLCRQCKNYFCLKHRYDHECAHFPSGANVSFPCSIKDCSIVEVHAPLCPKRMISATQYAAMFPEKEEVVDTKPEEDTINWTVTIDKLPGEILAVIFDNCDYQTTQTARLVCRRFHNVLEQFHFLGPTIKYITIRNAGHQVIEVVYPRTHRQFKVTEMCHNEIAVAELVNKLFRKVSSIKTLKLERIEFTEEFVLAVKKGFLKHSRNVNSFLLYGCSIGITGVQLQQLINKINPTTLEFERCVFTENMLSDKMFANCSTQITVTAWPNNNHFPQITDATLDSIARNIPPMVKFEDVRTCFSLSSVLDLIKAVKLFQAKASNFDARVNKSMAIFVALDCRPLSIVSDPGFRQFVEVLNPKAKLPSRTTLTRKRLPDLRAEIADLIRTKLKDTKWITLTIDAWSSISNKHSILCVTGHWVNESFELQNAALGTEVLSGRHTHDFLATTVRKVLAEFDINEENVTMITRDGAKNMEKMCSYLKIENSHCFAHLLQLAVKDSLKLFGKKLDETVPKIQKVTRKIRKSHVYRELFEEQLKLDDLPAKDTEVRWNSMYLMLTRFLENKKAIEHFLLDHVELPMISNDNWSVMEDVVSLLKPLAEATESVQSRYGAGISCIFPLIRVLKYKLGKLTSTSLSLMSAKKTLLQVIERRMTQFFLSDSHKMATILDPRWKNDFFIDSFKEEFEKRLLCGLRDSPKQIEASDDVVRERTEEPQTIFQEFKQVEGTRTCISPDIPETDLVSDVKKEINTYLSTPAEDKLDPYQFWRDNSKKFPHLSSHAEKWIAAPSSSAESERVFSSAGILVSNRRSALTPDNVGLLLFKVFNLKFFEAEIVA